MRYRPEQWVAVCVEGKMYVGRVKKIELRVDSTMVFINFCPTESWGEFPEHNVHPVDPDSARFLDILEREIGYSTVVRA
jgi:hypothetical protein